MGTQRRLVSVLGFALPVHIFTLMLEANTHHPDSMAHWVGPFAHFPGGPNPDSPQHLPPEPPDCTEHQQLSCKPSPSGAQPVPESLEAFKTPDLGWIHDLALAKPSPTANRLFKSKAVTKIQSSCCLLIS